MHAADKVPRWVLRMHAWFTGLMSSESRLVLGMFVVGLAVVVALFLSSFQILRMVVGALDIITFAGLFLVNWLGNGGALVPIPGARLLGLLMIFQHTVFFASWEVFLVSGAAMALGLLSYYLAGVRAADSYSEGDEAGAEQLATEAGMLDGVGPAEGAAAMSRRAGTAQAAPSESTTTAQKAGGRFSRALRDAQSRAQPVIEKHGVSGMFWLCVWPTPLGTAAAFVGGLMRFGFARFLATSFAAKYLLAGIVVVGGLVFSSAAASVKLPF